MKANRRVRREAKQLFRLCLTADGRVDDERAGRVVRMIAQSGQRSRTAILGQLRRLVKLADERRAARIETAMPLEANTRSAVMDRLERLYGPGLEPAFSENPALIAGMRIQVGNDVYDGSLRAALDALEAKL
jgi:F-type H+-transporting ATPase subunit delta